MMGRNTLKWTAYIAGGAMAVAFILPFVSRYAGTDDTGNDWQVTTGVNPVDKLAREKAGRTYQYFVDAIAASGDRADGYEVEVELRSKRGIPTAVWLDRISISENEMSGALTVTPPGGLRGDLRSGDTVVFTRAQVLDWVYPEDSLLRGHFRVRANLNRYKEQDRLSWLSELHESPIP
jgi:uncharacterized protein YegJ (DUF2314 family)